MYWASAWTLRLPRAGNNLFRCFAVKELMLLNYIARATVALMAQGATLLKEVNLCLIHIKMAIIMYNCTSKSIRRQSITNQNSCDSISVANHLTINQSNNLETTYLSKWKSRPQAVQLLLARDTPSDQLCPTHYITYSWSLEDNISCIRNAFCHVWQSSMSSCCLLTYLFNYNVTLLWISQSSTSASRLLFLVCIGKVKLINWRYQDIVFYIRNETPQSLRPAKLLAFSSHLLTSLSK